MKRLISKLQDNQMTGYGAMILATTLSLATFASSAGSQTHAWTFDDDSNPLVLSGGQATVTVGGLGLGWQAGLEGLPGATGFWDLGSSGQIQVLLASPVIGPAQITVQCRQWNDGVLYDTLAVTVPHATRVGNSAVFATASTAGIGAWQTAESVWAIAAGVAADEVLVIGPVTGGVVDSVSVSLPTVVVAPLELSIRVMEGGDIEVSWPEASGVAELQSRPVVNGADEWQPVQGDPQLVGDRYVITLAPDQDAAFFRLQQ